MAVDFFGLIRMLTGGLIWCDAKNASQSPDSCGRIFSSNKGGKNSLIKANQLIVSHLFFGPRPLMTRLHSSFFGDQVLVVVDTDLVECLGRPVKFSCAHQRPVLAC